MNNQKRYVLDIRVSIRDQFQGGILNVDQQVTINAGDFLEMSHILGKFHELAELVKNEYGVSDE